MADESINSTPPRREALRMAIPSRWDRFWWRLGFRETYASFHEEIEGLSPGFCSTQAYTYFDLLDRIRILISGKIMTSTAIKTDKPIARMSTKAGVSVLRPNHPKAMKPKKPEPTCS